MKQSYIFIEKKFVDYVICEALKGELFSAHEKQQIQKGSNKYFGSHPVKSLLNTVYEIFVPVWLFSL